MTEKTAVIYARFSSMNQREESIDEQIFKIESYAKENGIRIVQTYADYAKSGSKNLEKRTEFLKMIHDIEQGLVKVDYLLVYELSRFMRDRYQSAIYKNKLKEHNVKLVSVTETLNDNPESILLESLLEGLNEYYAKHLAMETMRGLEENARKGISTGGVPPLGYMLDSEKKLIVNPEEKPIIEIIFNDFAEGKSYQSIANKLNALGYRTRTNREFKINSFYDILDNEKYTGTYVFNKTEKRDGRGKRNGHKTKDEEDIIRIENCFEPIVSRELFDKVQRRKQERKNCGRRYSSKTNYLLAGLIYCGECMDKETGKMYSYIGNSRYYKNGEKPDYISYRCGNMKNRGITNRCQNKEIRREYIETYVLDELYKQIFNDRAIKYIVRGVNTKIQNMNKQNGANIIQLEKEINRCQTQIDNILNAIKQGIYDDSVSLELKSLRERKNEIQLALNNESKRVEINSVITEDMVRDTLYKFKDYVREKNIAECKKFIKSFVDKVIVYRDYIEVIFKVNFDLSEGSIDYQDLQKIYRIDLVATYQARMVSEGSHNRKYSEEYMLDYPIMNPTNTVYFTEEKV